MIHEMRDPRRLAMSLPAIAALFAAASFVSPHAQAPYDVKANYVKREVYIPMRDGVKLFTIIYSPRATTERYPMLMTRTAYGIGPYGPDGFRAVLGPNNEFAKEGYIFVYQDTRGESSSPRATSFITCRSSRDRRSRTKAPTPGTRSTGW
jgi:predicted acyl esterase